MKKYEYQYVVSFEDTNLVGNVYFAKFISWQGKCREFFIKEKVPDILELMEKNDISIITLNCSCNYLAELRAFDEIIISLELDKIINNRILMLFQYFKKGSNLKLVATGTHEIGFFKRTDGGLAPIPIPSTFQSAIVEYQND